MGVGAVIGLALLVLVANSATDGLGGEPLRLAAADGLSNAVLVVAGGIGATTVVAMSLGSAPRRLPRRPPCPRQLDPAGLRRAERG